MARPQDQQRTCISLERRLGVSLLPAQLVKAPVKSDERSVDAHGEREQPAIAHHFGGALRAERNGYATENGIDVPRLRIELYPRVI